MKTSEQVDQLFNALALASDEMGQAKADAINKHLGAEYASLAALQEAYKKPCAKYKLAVIQTVNSDGDNYFVETVVAHASGQWMSSTMKVFFEKQTMQSLGAAVTYAKRYSIASMLGLSAEVDDAAVEAVQKKASAHTQTKLAAVKVQEDLSKRLSEKPIAPQPPDHEKAMLARIEAIKPEDLEASKGNGGAINPSKLASREVKNYAPTSNPPYKFTFGKYTGKTIAEVGLTEAEGYLNYMIKEGERQGKRTVSPNVLDLEKAIATFKGASGT